MLPSNHVLGNHKEVKFTTGSHKVGKSWKLVVANNFSMVTNERSKRMLRLRKNGNQCLKWGRVILVPRQLKQALECILLDDQGIVGSKATLSYNGYVVPMKNNLFEFHSRWTWPSNQWPLKSAKWRVELVVVYGIEEANHMVMRLMHRVG
ncbi:unnamed protein product [Linum trigynum]|uniref:Uncharacterized protein n=1 Tax=Linum trigynum TaxID=586398 RepID=A0AAV2F6S6_9ROSI